MLPSAYTAKEHWRPHNVKTLGRDYFNINKYLKLSMLVDTIWMKHFGDKSHCRRFIWIFLCEFNGKFEGS